MLNSRNSVVFLISNEPWGDIWFSKQHYAHELSMHYQVFFINPTPKWNWKNLFSFHVDRENINQNLTILTYNNNFPVILFPSFFRWINDFFNCLKIKRQTKNITNSKEIVFWQFDPFRFINIFFLKPCARIYHVVDPYDQFKTDAIMARKASLVIVVNKVFEAPYKKLNKNILHIPHGVSKNAFSHNKEQVDEIRKTYGEYLIIAGTITNDYDFDLLKEIANAFPNKLLIIGPDKISSNSQKEQFTELNKLTNVIQLGPLPPNEMNDYIAGATVCLIPYELTKDVFLRTPLKVISYMAQKKAIISRELSDMQDLNNHIIFMAKNKPTYIALVAKALNGDLEYDNKLANEYLKEIQYTELIARIIKQLNT